MSSTNKKHSKKSSKSSKTKSTVKFSQPSRQPQTQLGSRRPSAFKAVSARASRPTAQAGPMSKVRSGQKAPQKKAAPKIILASGVPAANNGRFHGSEPKMHTEHTHAGSVLHVEHTEMIDSVISSNTTENFMSKKYSLNPQSGTFPWLAAIASRFDYYALDSLELIYTPNVGTTTNGRVAVAVNLDATDDIPTSLAELLMIAGSKTNAIYDTIATALKVGQAAANWYYCGTESSGDRLAAIGDIFTAITGVAATSISAGILSCRYKYRFKIPEMIANDSFGLTTYEASFEGAMASVSPGNTLRFTNSTTYPNGQVEDTSSLGSQIRIVAGHSGAPFPNTHGTHPVFFRVPAGLWRIDWSMGFNPAAVFNGGGYATAFGDGLRPTVIYDQAPAATAYTWAATGNVKGPSRTWDSVSGYITTLNNHAVIELDRPAIVYFSWYVDGASATRPANLFTDIRFSRSKAFDAAPPNPVSYVTTYDAGDHMGGPKGSVPVIEPASKADDEPQPRAPDERDTPRPAPTHPPAFRGTR